MSFFAFFVLLIVIAIVVLLVIALLPGGPKPCQPVCDKCGVPDGCNGTCKCIAGFVCTDGECVRPDVTICTKTDCSPPRVLWAKSPNSLDAKPLVTAELKLLGITPPQQLNAFLDNLLANNPFGDPGIPYVDFYSVGTYMFLSQRQIAYVLLNVMLGNGLGFPSGLHKYANSGAFRSLVVIYILTLGVDFNFTSVPGTWILVVRPTLRVAPSLSPGKSVTSGVLSEYEFVTPTNATKFWPILQSPGNCNIFEQPRSVGVTTGNLAFSVVFAYPEILVSLFWTQLPEPFTLSTVFIGARQQSQEFTSASPPNCFVASGKAIGPSFKNFTSVEGKTIYTATTAFIETAVVAPCDNNLCTAQRSVDVPFHVNLLYSTFSGWPPELASFFALIKHITSGPWGAENNNNDSQLFYAILLVGLAYWKPSGPAYSVTYTSSYTWCFRPGNQCLIMAKSKCATCLGSPPKVLQANNSMAWRKTKRKARGDNTCDQKHMWCGTAGKPELVSESHASVCFDPAWAQNAYAHTPMSYNISSVEPAIVSNAFDFASLGTQLSTDACGVNDIRDIAQLPNIAALIRDGQLLRSSCGPSICTQTIIDTLLSRR